MLEPNFFTRIRLLGPVSLAALFGGGVILVLVGLNALLGPKTEFFQTARETPYSDDSERMFLLFAEEDISFWCTVVGIASVLLWYGLTEAYIHLSARWCARKSGWGAGLDESSHINSLARRTGLLSLQYLFPLLCFAAAVVYHFGLIQIDIWSNGAIDQGLLRVYSLPPLGVYNTFYGPWAIEKTWTGHDQYFVHHQGYDQGPADPPSSAVMVGTLDCQSLLDPLSLKGGTLVSREVVMVANLTNEEGSFQMARDHDGWMRTQTSNKFWLGEENKGDGGAVVDYRIAEPGKVQIQWARQGSWLCEDGNGESNLKMTPVVRRVTYTIRYAVAMIVRQIHVTRYHDDCATAFDADILSIDSNPPPTDFKNGSLPHIWKWVDVMVGLDHSGVNDGVTYFLRAVMAGWTSPAMHRIQGPRIGLVAEGNKPFGPENTAVWTDGFQRIGRLGYPYFSGGRTAVYRGCDRDAAWIFLVVGCIAIVLGLARIRSCPRGSTHEIRQDWYMDLSGEWWIKEKQGGLVARDEVDAE
ncbi:hypothetical protein EDB81DRAFT_912848 [Dactylonectria macrodidyma]|uniref:Uncharacterized protein n=1 Tax=Dactylonectria macrodidyma TaxID=307937 RepID=A0A9P9DS97_9HYPO|nr:hypothetical protein EDB81DRAFT_912848 [Dactylonectria macrodidyma]